MVDPCDERLKRAQRILSDLGKGKPAQRGVVAHLAARWAVASGDSNRADQLFRIALDELPALRPAIRGIARVVMQGGEKKRVLEWLDLQIRATSHPREAAALYRERGRLIGQLFKDNNATRQCQEAALLAAPNDLSVLFSLLETHERSGNLEGASRALQKIADNVDDEGYKAVLEHANALLSLTLQVPHQEILNRLSWAARYSKENPILTHDAYRIAQAIGTPADQLEFLIQELQLREEKNAQGPALWRIAQLMGDVLDEPQQALELLRQASQRHPQRLHLCDQRLTRAAALKDHDEAVSAAIARVRILRDAEQPWQASAWYDLGVQVLHRDSHDPHGLACLTRAIELDPAHKAAAYRFLDVLREQGQHEEWVQTVRDWCQSDKGAWDPEEQSVWLEEAANVCIHHLVKPSLGHTLLTQARALNPNSSSIRSSLARVYFDEDDAVSLRKLYRQELQDTQDPDRELLLRTLLCHVVPEIQNLELAIEDNRSLLALKPGCATTTQQLARLIASSADPAELLAITLEESRLGLPDRKRATLVAKAGDLARSLGDDASAKSHYQKALKLEPTHDGARAALEALARQKSERSSLLEHLTRQLEQVPDAAGLRLEIADLLLEDPEQALDAMDVVGPLLDGKARSFCALRIGEKIACSLGDYPHALELMDRRFAMLEGPRARAFWLLRSAWIRWRHLGDHTGALEDLWRARTLAPDLPVIRWVLFELLAHHGSTRAWPWLRHQLQNTSNRAGMDPLISRWRIREAPTEQLVHWLSLDRSKRADGAAQCLDWLDPARRCQAQRLSVEILDRHLQEHSSAPNDPRRMMLRYLLTRSHAACRNWELANQHCQDIADWEPGHRELQGSMAARTTSIYTKQGKPLQAMIGRLKHQRTEQHSKAVRLHSSLWILDLLAQAGSWKDAIRRCDQLISTTPQYLPAHYLYIYCLEQHAGKDHLPRIADAYRALAKQHRDPALKAKALRKAGRRFVELATRDRNYRGTAWDQCQAAFELEPENDEGFSSLWQCATSLDLRSSSERLAKALIQRVEYLNKRDADAQEFIVVASLAERVLPVPSCLELLEGLVGYQPRAVALHLLKARAHAKEQAWQEAVDCVQHALKHESSRKRQGALHYFLGDLYTQASNTLLAIEHYMQAATLDFRIDEAGQAAACLAHQQECYDQQVAALELLVDRGRRQDRPRYMRELADLYRGPLQRVDRAIDLISRLVSSTPDDSDAVALLYQLLTNAQRLPEAQATLRVATTRLQNKFRSRNNFKDEHPIPIEAVHGVRRFFELDNETDGVYLATAVIEIIAPHTLEGPGCDVLRSEPWSLPCFSAGLGASALLPALLREIPSAFALRRMVHVWPHLPLFPDLNRPIPQGSKTLSADRDASRVVHTLGSLLGFKRVHVTVNLSEDDNVLARWSPQGVPTLVLGRRVYNAPIAPRSRDAIGRAIFRLATGGDCFRDSLCERQRRALALLPDLVEGRITLNGDDEAWVDCSYAQACLDTMPDSVPYTPLSDVRERSRSAMIRSILPLDTSLESAEDRFGAICTGDPRIALALRAKQANAAPELYADLVAYVLSNAHLELRRELGYQHLVELDVHDLEVLPL